MATPGLPVKPVRTWKRLAIVSFFGGVGFASFATLILGSFLWYKSRPSPPKPWNNKAITAKYDTIGTVGDENHIVFYYNLENTTDQDYRALDNSGIDLTAKLEEQNSLSPFDKYEKIEYPVFIPSKRRVRFGIEIPYRYKKTLPSDAPIEDRRKFRKELEQYVETEMSNLNGFVLFDSDNRYEIEFPKGWNTSQDTAASNWKPNWETKPDKTKPAKSQLTPTIAFSEDWLHFVPTKEDDRAKAAEEKAAFIAAMQQAPNCKTVVLKRDDPDAADFDFQIFNGIDGRTGKWQWVLYRTDIEERLAYGESANLRSAAQSVCANVLSNSGSASQKAH